MNSQPIKTELFRFATLKSPKRISAENKKIGYIYHPDYDKGFFLKQVTSSNIALARSQVRELVSKFAPLPTYLDARDLASELYDFSDWVKSRREHLKLMEAKTYSATLSLLDEKTKITLWDNIFHQLIKKNNPTLRQACIQILQADYFLNQLQNPNLETEAIETVKTPRTPESPTNKERIAKYVKKIATAKLIIPKVFSVERKKTVADSRPTSVLNNFSKSELKRRDRAMKSQNRLQKLSRIQLDLNKNGTQLTGNLKKGKSYLNVTSLDLKAVSKETSDFISNYSRKRVSLSLLKNQVNQEIVSEKRSEARTILPKKKVRLYHGLRSNTDKVVAYGYQLSMSSSKDKSITMIIKLNEGEYIKTAKYRLKFDGHEQESLLVDRGIEVIKTSGEYVLIKLFPNEELPNTEARNFGLKGVFILNTGKRIDFKHLGNESESEYSGIGVINDGGTAKPSTNTDVADGRPAPLPGNNDSNEATEHEEDSGSDEAAPIGIDEESIEYVELYGVNRLGLGVFRKVEQEVCCYVPGEVSRIENVMAKEYKERHTRSLTSSETTEETTEEVEMESQTDSATSTRNEISSEIATVLNRATNTNASATAGVSGSYGGVSFFAGGTVGFASSNASTYSDTEAQIFSEEITQSALERVLQKVTTKRTSKIVKEYEENNRHGFDNRAGDTHVSGVYRWVDVIYKNRVVNYGKRLMVEFLIPEPSKLYKWAIDQELEQTGSSQSGTELEEPTPLDENGILGPESITRSNYTSFGRAYGLTNIIEPFPDDYSISETHEFDEHSDPIFESKGKDLSRGDESFRFSLPVTNEYQLKSVEVYIEFEYNFNTRGTEDGTYFRVDGADYSYEVDEGISDDVDDSNMNLSDQVALSNSNDYFLVSESGVNNTHTKIVRQSYTFSDILVTDFDIEVNMKNVHDFKVKFTTTEEVQASIEEAWKEDVYYQILDAYEGLKQDYENSLQVSIEEAAAKDDERAATNPELNRNIEKRELKRSAIEMTVKPFESVHGIEVGEDHFGEGDCKEPIINQTKDWETYSSHVKFFEQALEWNLMDYIFYPYYWTDRCSWAELLQTKDSSDPIFESFLQSGMARIVVPVRLGFEDSVDLYMETGDIWNGGDLIVDTDDDLYISIADELQEVEGFVGEEWQSRVPTTLTVIQSDSVALEATGLPCCNDVDSSALGLLGSTNTLSLLDNTSDEE